MPEYDDEAIGVDDEFDPEVDDDGVEDQEFRVNFSNEEADSEARDYEALPSGKYHVTIFDGEVKRSKSAKNPGKPFWALTLRVASGKYENRRLFDNVMLFEGAGYSLAQLMKATGHEDALKTGVIPKLSTLIGEEVTVVVTKNKDEYKMKEADPNDPPIFRNNVRGYKKFDGNILGDAPAYSAAGSIEP